MDAIEKFLSKLSSKERLQIIQVLKDIIMLALDTYDVKKIKGYEDLYRIKKGKIRILFLKKDGQTIITAIGFRKNIYEKI